MIYTVAISDKHMAHIIQADEGINLVNARAACGRTSDRWQLYFPEEFNVRPPLCKRCNIIMFGSNGQGGEAQPVDGG